MARPRAKPTPTWSSSSRMLKTKNTKNTTKNTNVQVVLYDQPRYVAGVSTVASRPISLVPQNDTKDAYIVDKVITPFDGWGPQAATAEEYDTDEEDARYAADPARRQVQRVLNYVVGWRSDQKPQAFELVPCTRILEYVSPYVLEAYEEALCERRRSHFKEKKEADNSIKKKLVVTKRGRPRKNKAKTDKKDKKDDDRAQRALAQQRDGNGKFQCKALSTVAVSPQRASLSQPVILLSSIPSLSPSKTRTVEPPSLKRPYESFAEQTETDDVEVEDSEDDESDDELAKVPRMTPVPLPVYASASSASSTSSSSRSTPAASTQTTSTKNVTRVEPPRFMGMRGKAPWKKVKVEVKQKTDKKEWKEKKVTPVPLPAFGQPRQSQPKEEPPQEDDDEEEIYEVDRLEGDCYTYIDDDSAVPNDGSPPPKKLVQYFSVRWKGNWPPDQNPTWEPAENLPPRMVQQYLRRLARREQALKQAQRDGASQNDDDLLLDASSDDEVTASQGDLAPIVSSDII